MNGGTSTAWQIALVSERGEVVGLEHTCNPTVDLVHTFFQRSHTAPPPSTRHHNRFLPRPTLVFVCSVPAIQCSRVLLYTNNTPLSALQPGDRPAPVLPGTAAGDAVLAKGGKSSEAAATAAAASSVVLGHDAESVAKVRVRYNKSRPLCCAELPSCHAVKLPTRDTQIRPVSDS